MKEPLILLFWVVILWLLGMPHVACLLFFWGGIGVAWFSIERWQRKKRMDDFP
jgi:hypothetical protein